ncbi:MAG TPA: hypothetical protein VFR37_01165 [Longimicrobium sp.]|nr:hypothetical protein [Longimicrobium sp.]
MAHTFEEQYADVLQNIEFAIVETYRGTPELLDYHVDAALEAAIARYSAEQQGRTPRPVTLEGARLQVYEAVRNACEWRLGREEIRIGSDLRLDEPPEPKRLDEIVSCLKRIRKSVQRWTKQRGRQGYLKFVSQYV